MIYLIEGGKFKFTQVFFNRHLQMSNFQILINIVCVIVCVVLKKLIKYSLNRISF